MAEPTRYRSNLAPRYRAPDDARRWDYAADSALTGASFDNGTGILTLDRVYFDPITVNIGSVLPGDAELGGLSDVSLSGLVAGHGLFYDGANWVNRFLVESDIPSEITRDSELATVATTGDYNDLFNKPDLSVFDDVLTYADFASFPGTGDSGKVYVAEDTGYLYRWDGSQYVQLTDQTAIWGQVSGTLSDQTDLQAALDAKAEVGGSGGQLQINDGAGGLDGIPVTWNSVAAQLSDTDFAGLSVNGVDVVAGVGGTANQLQTNDGSGGLAGIPVEWDGTRFTAYTEFQGDKFLRDNRPIRILDKHGFDPRITVTRASNATRFNERGLLEEVGANVLRLDYDPVTLEPRRWLIEGSATNEVAYSEDLGGADWKLQGTSVSIGGTLSRKGVTFTEVVVGNANDDFENVENNTGLSVSDGGAFAAQTLVIGGSTARSEFSVRETGGSGYVDMIIDWSGGVPTINTEREGNGFTLSRAEIEFKGEDVYKLILEGVNDTGASVNLDVHCYVTWNAGNSAGDNIYYGAVQLESGSSVSSYIKTEGSPVTRAADNAVIDGTDFSTIWNDSEGTIVGEIVDAQPNDRLVDVEYSGSSSNNRVSLHVGGNGECIADVRDAGGTDNFFNDGQDRSGQDLRWAFAIGGGSGSLYANGELIESNSATIAATLDRVRVGSGGNSLRIQALYYYPHKLTDEELQFVSVVGRDLTPQNVGIPLGDNYHWLGTHTFAEQLGIRTDAPIEALDANGNARIRGELYVDPQSDITINIPSDYATLQAAFDDWAGRVLDRNRTVTVNIESGHQPSVGLQLFSGDWSNFKITSTDATVVISTSFSSGPYDFNNHFFRFENCIAPTIDAFFDANNSVDRGSTASGSDVLYDGAGPLGGTPIDPVIDDANSSYASGIVYENASGTITAGSGFKNCLAHGLLVSGASNVRARDTIWSYNALFADCGSVDGGNGNTSNGCGIRFGAQADLTNAEASYCGCNGFQTSTGSNACLRGVTANYNDRYGIRATQGGFHDCRDSVANNNGAHGIYSSFGSHVSAGGADARDNNRWKGWTAYVGGFRTDVACIVGGTLDFNYGTSGSKWRDNASALNRELSVGRGGTMAANNATDYLDSGPGLRAESNGSNSVTANTPSEHGIIYF